MQTAENGYLCLDKKAVLGCERSGLGLEIEKEIHANMLNHGCGWLVWNYLLFLNLEHHVWIKVIRSNTLVRACVSRR